MVDRHATVTLCQSRRPAHDRGSVLQRTFFLIVAQDRRIELAVDEHLLDVFPSAARSTNFGSS
jgi:hypothetical protein